MTERTPGTYEAYGPTVYSPGEGIICTVCEPHPDDHLIEYHAIELGSPNFEEAMQNRDFVVCACNAHDDLLAACEAALGSETSADCRADRHGYCQAHRLEPIDECWVLKVERAIAKVKGADE